MQRAEPGTISHGTMREEDLIPDFVAELRRLGHEDGELDEIEARLEAHDTVPYYGTEEAGWDLNEYLFEALNEHAPEGHYFGSHPGDGSDYGFWPNEED